MRIITGKARGIRLETLDGLDTRPTSERTKEAVFSMLQFDIAGSEVLDLFAGSGCPRRRCRRQYVYSRSKAETRSKDLYGTGTQVYIAQQGSLP